jgi:hypothetical protein
MATIYHISQKPTFDITDIELLNVTSDGACYIKSIQVYGFDKVYGSVINRSRVLQEVKEESRYVESVIGSVVDAGFQGYLFWKIKLTKFGLTEYTKTTSNKLFVEYLRGAQQLLLSPIPSGNYYDGTNQTDLTPDIIFEI